MTGPSLFDRVRLTRWLLLLGVLWFTTSPAAALTITWDANGANPPNGSYQNFFAWNPNQVPFAGDTALFNIADTYTVTFFGNAVSDTVEVPAGTVSFRSGSATVRTYDLLTGAADLVVRGGTLNVGAVGNPIDLNVGDQLHIGDSVASGTVIVSGSGSRLDATGAAVHGFGFNGHTGTLTFRSLAQGTINAAVSLGNSFIPGSQGNLNVFTDADLTTASLNVSTNPFFGASGNVTVDGGGATLTQSGASTLNVGSSTGGAGTLTVSNSGVFTSGTGAINVNATGTINVGVVGGGTFNANDNVTVDGGTITRGSDSASFNVGGLTLTAKNDAQINFAGDYEIGQGGTFNIQSGADFSTTGDLDIANGIENGTLVVEGPGSSVTTGPGTYKWGFDGTANVTFRNGSTGDLGGIDLARNGLFGATGDFDIESGATVTTNSLFVAVAGGATTSGTIKVDGGTSSLTQNGGSSLTVGHSSNGTAKIDVQNGGTFNTGAGLTTINTTGTLNVNTAGTFNALGNIDLAGTINLDGGTLSAVDLVFTGSTFNFPSGTLEFNSNQTLNTQRFADLDIGTLGAGKTFRVNGVATLSTGVSLEVDGGTLHTAGLVLLPGSSLRALAPSTITTGTLQASLATTINATDSDMTLGDASAVNGFYSNGNVLVGGGSTLTLLDANDAVFDSGAFVTLGNGGLAGTIVAANGLTLDFGGNITGFGTVNTPDSAATPLINNGNITGDDPNQVITLTGYVKGVGTLDNVLITGTDAPGFSTAAVNRGSVSYNGTLEIELGGTNPGSGYDQLNHILGDGIAELGGTLDVLLLGGFVPSLGDTFDILTATGGVNGTFASTLFPDLGALLAMDLFYDINTVTLTVVPALPGDFDIDGDVDGFDFLKWQRGESPNPLSAADLALWEAQYGTTSALAASAAVPEPTTWMMLMLGMAAKSCAWLSRRLTYRSDSYRNAR